VLHITERGVCFSPKLLVIFSLICYIYIWRVSCEIVGIRLKAIKNIQKITKSMKMVSAAKYAKADRDLRLAKPYGVGAQGCINSTFSLSELTDMVLCVTSFSRLFLLADQQRLSSFICVFNFAVTACI